MQKTIRIRGARQHNLKGLNLDLPRGALTVITGPSGSGKSSLALDTLFAAGQRRYVEALSTYAKQFLDRLEKPDVDRIEGLCPAISIEQRKPTSGSRSTIGTATEIYDFLRLLFARVGRTHCPECEREVRPDTVTGAALRVAGMAPGTRLMLTFPWTNGGGRSPREVAGKLRSLGFARVLADGAPVELSEVLVDSLSGRATGADQAGPSITASTAQSASHRSTRSPTVGLAAATEILVVVDRIKVPKEPTAEWQERLADSLATCFREGDGNVVVVTAAERSPDVKAQRRQQATPDKLESSVAQLGQTDPTKFRLSTHFRCPDHPNHHFTEPDPRLFSFNNPYGSCPNCTGFGATLDYDPTLVIPNPRRSLEEGAVDPWAKPRYGLERSQLRRFAVREGVSTHTPWQELPTAFRNSVLYGAKKFQGVFAFLASKEPKRYKQYIRVFLRQYQSARTCQSCHGSRLRPEARQVKVGSLEIGAVVAMPVTEVADWLTKLTLRPSEREIAASILREIRSRVSFLVDVGLGYLTLNRLTRTLSGGEAQRIALANALGSQLVDTLYVLDEPSIGLHAQDIGTLIGLLTKLRDAGNTVVVVEHNHHVIKSADFVVELGPGSGNEGGDCVFEGSPRQLMRSATATGQYLSQMVAHRGSSPQHHLTSASARWLCIKGATLHNLHGVDAEFPLGAMTVITGVSGSGKSTLVQDVLYHALEKALGNGEPSVRRHLGEKVGSYDSLTGVEGISQVVLVDQSPIGRSSRSNPATYIKVWDDIRRIFAREPTANSLGLNPGDFSFNVKGGRCEKCKGAGQVEVEMLFMADISVPCDSCDGKRYRPHVLDIKVGGLNIAEVLELTVDQAIRFFLRERRLGRTLWQLQQVGLGYIRLGQPATTLSGGEAQRLKIARELASPGKRQHGPKIYLLDEPTTGLSGPDVAQLTKVLQKLREAGNTIIVVEHDLDLIAAADWVIDLGPGAGEKGGTVVAAGSPEDVAKLPASITGRFLKAALGHK